MSSHSDSELKMDTRSKPKKNLHMVCKAKGRSNKDDMLQSLKFMLNKPHILTPAENRLLSAVGTNNTELVQQLLETKVNPNIVDRQQRSALHVAVSRGYTDVVCLLLKHNADPNAQDIIGNTPLHLAACMSNMRMITVLLDAGANVRCLDLHGRNPLQLAESKLQILRRSWKSGAIETLLLRTQLEQIVHMMLSMWGAKEQSLARRCDKRRVEDLKLLGFQFNMGPDEDVDDQMLRLQNELRDFSLK